MLNPVTFARISANISKTEFPKKLHVSRTYTIRSEQGCYVTPSDRIINFSCSTLKMSKTQFMKQYRTFQDETRLNTIRSRDIKPINITALLTPVGSVDESSEDVTTTNSREQVIHGRSHHPTRYGRYRVFMHEEFRKWRLEYYNSRIEFCAGLCLHPTSVELYEEGKYKSMPDQIEEVMIKYGLLGNLVPDRQWLYAKS